MNRRRLPLVLLIASMLFAVAMLSQASAAYGYYRVITIDHTEVSANLTDFPVLVAGTYPSLATVSNGGHVQNANGYDVAFTSDSGCTSNLQWETEAYNATTGKVVYWVKYPTISSTTDIVIYLCYGDSGITTDQSNKTGVWDNSYVGVYHLPDGTTLSALDSTGNGINGTATGATVAAGQIDGAANFSGSGHYITLPYNARLHPSAISLSAWVNPSDLPGTDVKVISTTESGGYSLAFNDTGAGLTADVNVGGTYYHVSNSSVVANRMIYAVATYNGSNLLLYLNGSLAATNTTSGNIRYTVSNPACIGGEATGTDCTGGFSFHGVIDELRVSNISRSASWISTEYNNQYSPSTFYSVSSEAPTPTPTFSYFRPITINATNVGAGTQTDFPVLVTGVYSYLATVPNGGKVQNANGYDIAFYADATLTQKLQHETEYYNPITGNVSYWVKIPSLPNTTDTTFYIAYGDSHTTTDQSNKTGAWNSNYVGVFHLGNSTTLSINDSTLNAGNGSASNGTSATNGKISGAASLVQASNQFAEVNNSAVLNPSSITASAWFYANSWPGNDRVVQKGTAGVNSGDSGYRLTSEFGVFKWDVYVGTPDSIQTSIPSTGAWHYIAGTYDSSGASALYVDGALAISGSFSAGSVSSSTSDLYIGQKDGASNTDAFDGFIDEVRVSNAARSSGWIYTEYNNQYSPSTFYTIGSESSEGPLFCTMSTSSLCAVNWTKLIGVANGSGGYNNAHAQNYTYGTYANSVCCTADPYALTDTCGTTVLRLAYNTNSHVQQANESTYFIPACLSASPGNITCEYDDAACSAGFSCVASIVGVGSGNSTNAHIGDCAQYTRKVCCEYISLSVCINETGSCYHTIQQAVTAASAGQTVVITDGATYNENVTVAKNLTLTSNGTTIPTVSVTDNTAIQVTTSSVLRASRVALYGSAVVTGSNGIVVGSGSALQASNITITLTSPSDAGWSIYTYGSGTSSVNDSTIVATNGSGIYLGGPVIVNRTSITVSGSSGSAIAQGSGLMTVENSALSSSYQGLYGITVAMRNSTLYSAYGSQMYGVIDNSSVQGGGTPIYSRGLTVTNSVVGGLGIFSLADVGDTSLAFVNTTFTGSSPYVTASDNGAGSVHTAYVLFLNSSAQPGNVSYSRYGSGLANITFQRFLDVYVNNSGGSAVSGATVNATDNTSALSFTTTSQANGSILTQNVTYARQFFASSGDSLTYVTNHTISANKSGAGTANASVNMTTNQAITLTLGNHAPSVPILVAPTNASNVSERYPTFNWTASTDPEGDAITYQWNLSSPAGCAAIPLKNTSNVYYTSVDKLCVDKAYNWSVRACDTSNACSAYATNWTFTVQSSVGIVFTHASTDFGLVVPSDPGANRTNDTLGNSPLPLVYNNTGNVDVATSIIANAALWSSQALNTSYFQYADENSSAWANMTGSYTALDSNVTMSLLRELELKIWIPQGELPGAKNTTVTVLGASIE